jgi:hypothetical protein
MRVCRMICLYNNNNWVITVIMDRTLWVVVIVQTIIVVMEVIVMGIMLLVVVSKSIDYFIDYFLFLYIL